jgi:hypothetical protein
VYDPLNHEAIEQPQQPEEDSFGMNPGMVPALNTRKDLRWLLCKRPVVVVGGELILQSLS